MSFVHWVWLQQVLGYNSSKLPDVLHFYGTAEGFYKAPVEEKIKLCKLSKKQIEALHSLELKSIYAIVDRCDREQIKILTPADPWYATRLATTNNPPCVLYVAGELPDIDAEPAIAVVGPRKPTEYGAKAAFSLSARLALAGLTIISGGALGVDSMAHMGAIQGGGKTIAVLGSGICSDYLRANAPLRELVRKNGCLLSEFPPDAPVSKFNFPIRNRLISALSVGTVVVEAGMHSGALITARHAADQGKDVFVIPGSPSEPNYAGSNRLIRDGAKPLLSVEDIFEEYKDLFGQKIDTQQAYALSGAQLSHKYRETLAFLYPKSPKSEVPASAQPKVPPTPAPKPEEPAVRRPTPDSLSEKARRAYAAFTQRSMSTDELAEQAGLLGGELFTALMELEIHGFVRALPGGRFECIE